MVARIIAWVLLLFSVSAYPYGGNLTDVRDRGWSYPVDYRVHERCAQFTQYSGHVGVDLCRDVGTEVFAIDGGCVENFSSNLSGFGGVDTKIPGGAVLLRHVTSTKRVFYAVYGHVVPNESYLKERMCSDGSKKEVEKEHLIAWVDEYKGGANHLHFGIHPDIKDSKKEYRGNGCFSSDNCGWVDPINTFLAANNPGSQQYVTKEIPTQAKYGWSGGKNSDRCEDAVFHYRIDDTMCYPVTKEEACRSVVAACSSPPQSNHLSAFTGVEKGFFSSLWKFVRNSSHDWFGIPIADACNELIAFRVVVLPKSGQGSVKLASREIASYNVPFPPTVSKALVNFTPRVLPDMRIWSVGLYDEDRELSEQHSWLDIGRVYDIHVYPRADGADADNGVDPDTDNIETDIFTKSPFGSYSPWLATDNSCVAGGSILDS